MNTLGHWLVTTVAIIITAYLLPGVSVSGLVPALVAAMVLAIINVFLKPILIILTLPINIVTLGLFTFVINVLLIQLTSAVVPGFDVASFWWALLFSLILSLVSSFLYSLAVEPKPTTPA
jgi:putative membrane protein